MIGNESAAKHTVQRIADALGVDVSIFYCGSVELCAAHDTLGLLSAFKAINDVDDRRSCLEFVTAVAARERLGEVR